MKLGIIPTIFIPAQCLIPEASIIQEIMHKSLIPSVNLTFCDVSVEEYDVASSNTGPEEEISSQSENETSSSIKDKVPPHPPLDLTSVMASEDEQKLVPSQSDVLDILSIASKGSNEVTSENLRQVRV